MSQTKKRFKFISEYHRTTETLTARNLGHGVYIGVHEYRVMPVDIDDEEQTTSIVMPKEEIPAFIKFLQEIVKDETERNPAN